MALWKQNNINITVSTVTVNNFFLNEQKLKDIFSSFLVDPFDTNTVEN